MIMTTWRPLAAVLLCGAIAGWVAQGWRKDAGIAVLQREEATNKTTAASEPQPACSRWSAPRAPHWRSAPTTSPRTKPTRKLNVTVLTMTCAAALCASQSPLPAATAPLPPVPTIPPLPLAIGMKRART